MAFAIFAAFAGLIKSEVNLKDVGEGLTFDF